MVKAERLKRILNPDRVAWFGGGGIAPAIEYMRSSGFSGEAVAVNPNRPEIADLCCVSTASALPWTPDLSVLVIPKHGVLEVIPALAKAGCGGAICITSGFSESDGGEDLQAVLVDGAGDMPVIGPNCPGIANYLDGNAFMLDHFGNHTPKSGVAVISNGGAYLSDLGCADRSQPIAYLIGLGNQAMVGMADMLELVLDDPRVTAVNLYFEGINDAAGLSRAAAKAARRRIPVVAIKGGRSDAGKRAARSHTASLAGDAEVASALFRRFGWIEVKTPSEAIETVKMLSFTAIPRGTRTGFVTSSGSYAVLGGDVANKAGLIMDPPDEASVPALDAALPGYVGPANPLDISDAHGWPREHQLPIYRAFARNDYDIFAQVMCYPPKGGWDMTTWDATTSALAEAVRGKPVAFVNTLAEALPRRVRERMITDGMAPLQGMEDGLHAVAHAARYGARREALDPDAMHLDQVSAVNGDAGDVLRETAAKAYLAEAGLDLPKHWIVEGPDGLPNVSCLSALKAIVPGLLHKTEVGGVALNISPSDLPAAIRDMHARLQRNGLRPEGYLIEEMIASPVVELLVGLRRVAGIGPVLTLASGGVAVELLQDKTMLILPASRDDIEAALHDLKLAPLFLGYRGRVAADPVAVLSAIQKLCSCFMDDTTILELEVNPLLLSEDRAVIADAVLTRSRKAG